MSGDLIFVKGNPGTSWEPNIPADTVGVGSIIDDEADACLTLHGIPVAYFNAKNKELNPYPLTEDQAVKLGSKGIPTEFDGA